MVTVTVAGFASFQRLKIASGIKYRPAPAAPPGDAGCSQAQWSRLRLRLTVVSSVLSRIILTGCSGPSLMPLSLGMIPTLQTGHPISPVIAHTSAAIWCARRSAMWRVATSHALSAVTPLASKPASLRPEPGAMFRGQLSPTVMASTSVRQIGIANGNKSFGKKPGGTTVREDLCFFTVENFAQSAYESLDARFNGRVKGVPATRNPR